ncbi:MAG: twin-arginine translocase subunit TatC [Rhodospirillaceae bacterium]
MAVAEQNRDEESLDDSKMSLLEHLVELRTRLLWSVVVFLVSFFVCFAVAQQIYDFLVQPLADIMERVGGSRRMIYTALTEAFFTYVKVGAFGAAVISFPVVAAQMWMFIAPGLYRHEKRAFLPFLLVSPMLFALGAAMVYYLVMPMAWEFLLGFQTTREETVLPIELEAKVGEYLGLVMKLILAFGFGFQMPVALTLMARVGLVTSTGLASARKYAIVAVFVAAAIITPPDVISQLLLAAPMVVLYEISIICARIMERKRGEAEEDDLDDDPDPTPPAKTTDGSGDEASAAAVATGTDVAAKQDPDPELTADIANEASVSDAQEDGMIDETDWNTPKT